ncbi:hypothetical protein P0Y35_03615 [Kiritimatiellaeota bacterium B1221]|nr:hypothetical protein [Kiritimatiellaeota bacterium B1221]
MNDSNTLRIENLPKPIADKLAVTSRRIRRIVFLRGLFTVLSIALVTLLAVMVIDAATLLFSSGIRWLLSLSAFAVIAFSVFRYLIRPLNRKLSLAEIARIIETRSENLQDERISSAVEILTRQYKEGEAFSPVLLNQLVMDAEKDADVILPQQLFTLQSAKRVMISLGVIAFVYLVLFVVWPGSSTRLLVRAVAPFADVGGALADRLEIQPGDIRLATGDPLTIEVGFEKAHSRTVELRTRWEGGPELVENMQSADPGSDKKVFSTGFPRVGENFEYRIRSGPALSRFHQVQVFPRPEMTQVYLQVRPPAYTGLETYTESFTPGRIQALAGSEVKLAIESNIPLEKADLILDSHSLGAGQREMTDQGERLQWTFPVTGEARSFDWQVKMKSGQGFENKPVLNHVFTVMGDQLPVIDLDQPAQPELTLPPDGFLTLAYRVRDDFGISACELKVTFDGSKTILLGQAFGEPVNGSWPVSIPLYLQSLKMEDAQSLDIALVVYDNLPESLGGPQRAVSERLRIVIEQGRENFVHQQVKAQHEKTASALENALSDLERMSRQADEVNKDLAAQKTAPALETADEIRKGLEKTEAELSVLVSELEKGVFDPVAKGLKEVVEEEIQTARHLGEALSLSDHLQEQQEMAQALEMNIDTALEKVRILDALNNEMAENALRLAELEELSRQQDALVDQVNAEDWEENLDDWKAQQDALAAELAALAEEDAHLQEFAENAQSATENMLEAAEDAEMAAALAEEVTLPPWMIAQDQALQAQRNALAAQEFVIKAQERAGKVALSAMEVHQQRAEVSQSEADIAQLEAEKAQREAMRLLKEGGTANAQSAQEQANRLQAEAKTIQLQADIQQKNAKELQKQEAEKEPPNTEGVKDKQHEAKQIEQRAYFAQQKAIEQQQLALETAMPDWDQALSEAVAQQQAAETAQQAALDAQQAAEEALESIQDVSTAQQAAAEAQSAAESAQENALAAQKAAKQAQEAAAQSGNPQANESANAAQQAATEAQNAAEQAQQQAAQAQEQVAQMQAESGQQEAAAAQQAAADSQQNAQQAQEAASEAQAAANQAQQAAIEAGTAEARQHAQDAQTAARQAQEDAIKAQAQAAAAQEQAERVAKDTVENAQQAAAQAQQEATVAQQAATEAQLAAQEAAETPADAAAQANAAEAQQQAQAAQQAANQAQNAARAAAEQAKKSGNAEDLAAAETAQQAATIAQEQAASSQQTATAAQPQTTATQSQTAAMDAALATEAAALAAAMAAEAAAEAGLSEVAEELNQLAGEALETAEDLSNAAQQPGLPSANEAMTQSAAQMSEIAQSMAGLTPSAPSEAATAAMALAAAQASAAAQSTSQNQAATQSAAAAQALQQASQSIAQEMGMETPPSESSATSSASESRMGGKDNKGPNDERVPDWVSDIGLTRADWFRMRKLSEADGGGVVDSGIPREYRQLVRDYFMELNREQNDAP